MNTNTFTVSNEHLLLINILNTMYNDNNRQIQNLNNQNNQIINIITDILHVPSNIHNNRQNNSRQNNSRYSNNNSNSSSNYDSRIFLNNSRPIIDNIQEYNISNIISDRNYYNNIPTNTVRNASINASRNAATNASRNAATQPIEGVNNIFSTLLQSFFDPIIINPTHSQYEFATRRVMYNDIISPINNSCPISMDTFNDNDMVTIIRYCGHIFNSEELNTWFSSNCRCPVCRYDIRDYNSHTNLNHISSRNISSSSNEERNNYTVRDISGNILPTQYSQDISGNSVQW